MPRSVILDLNSLKFHIELILLGYTVSRAILSDAIALTRGDRFFTTGYTPANMTTWGLADCTRDPESAGFGSMLGRLLLRALPEQYSEKSIYTWFVKEFLLKVTAR